MRLPIHWTPNFLTVLRIALTPVFVWLALSVGVAEGPVTDSRLGAAVVLCAIGGSDLLDGFLARRFGWTSRLGAVLDAVADKFAQLTIVAFLTLFNSGSFFLIPIWFFGLMVLRDILLGLGTLFVLRSQVGVSVEHESHGRLASVLLFLLILWITLGLPEAPVLPGLVLAAVAVTYSTVRYFVRGIADYRGTGVP